MSAEGERTQREASRRNTILILIVCVLLVCFGVYNLSDEYAAYARIETIRSEGIETSGSVTEISREVSHVGVERKTRVQFAHTVTYDGHASTVTRSSAMRLGTKVRVLCLADEPEKCLVGDPADTFADLREVDWPSLAFGLSFYGLLALGGIGGGLFVIVRRPIGLWKSTRVMERQR